MKKTVMILTLIAFSQITVHAQITMNAQGRVGIGTASNASYQLSTIDFNAYYSKVNFSMGIGGSWVNGNTLTVTGTGAETYALYIGGIVKSGGRHLYVNGSTWSTSGWTSSDMRLKKNIKPLDKNILIAKIRNIEGKNYEFKNRDELLQLYQKGQMKFSSHKPVSEDNATLEEVVDVPQFSQGKQYGLLAQEVAKEFPELVSMDEESGMYGVNYEGFIPILLEIVKGQQDVIDGLEKRLATVENKDKNFGVRLGDTEPDASISGSKTTMNQNVPNPSGRGTSISYYISETTLSATLYIYDMNGIQLKSYSIPEKGAGKLDVEAGELKAGMYLYSLVVDGQLAGTKRMILTD